MRRTSREAGRGSIRHFRELAGRNHLAFCDIRKAMFEYLADHNPENKDKGILTYDGIHFSALGNALTGNLVAKGIAEVVAAGK